MPIVLDACAFATRMHAGQQRKYTGEPYVLHCLEVARIVAEGTPPVAAALSVGCSRRIARAWMR